MDRDREQAIAEHLQVANEVLDYCGFSERVRVLEECTPSMFVCMFESLFRAKLNNIERHPRSLEDHLHNCTAILDVLANHVLKVDLSYISAESVCQGDHQSIMLLIEILYELMKIVISRKNNEDKGQQTPEENKEQKIQSDLDVSEITSDPTKESERMEESTKEPQTPSSVPFVSTPHVPTPPSHPRPASSRPSPSTSSSSSSSRPSPSRAQQHVFAKNIPRMPSPIKTLGDSSSSLSSSSGNTHSSPYSSSTSSSSSSPSLNRERRVGSPRTAAAAKERRREIAQEHDEGNENQDSNVMFTSPSKADTIQRKSANYKSPSRVNSSTTPTKKKTEKQRERDELARCVDNIDREIRASESPQKSLSPAKRVHFTPSLDKHSRHTRSSSGSSSDVSGSFTEEDQQSFKDNIRFHGSDREFYEGILESIPENVPRYVWENPLRQWLKIRPVTSPDKAQRVAYAKEHEMANRTSELVQSMIKDYEAAKRRSEHLERIRKKAGVHAEIRDRREQMVRLQKMETENETERKSRMLKRQSHEELLYKNLFAQSLKIQKQRVIDERKESRERKDEYERQCAIRQQSIENYYLQQYDLLRTQIGEETRNQQISEHAQQVALKKLEGELKRKMRDQLDLLKEQLRNEEELSYFRLFDSQQLYDALTRQ